MTELQWDDSIDDSKEYFNTAVALPVDQAERVGEVSKKASSPKTQFTDLRRRIEERLDSKRIEHEFEFDDLDGLLDTMS